jgi:hypothetical protein
MFHSDHDHIVTVRGKEGGRRARFTAETRGRGGTAENFKIFFPAPSPWLRGSAVKALTLRTDYRRSPFPPCARYRPCPSRC